MHLYDDCFQVPAKVSYEAFWHHYFYRVHLMDQLILYHAFSGIGYESHSVLLQASMLT